MMNRSKRCQPCLLDELQKQLKHMKRRNYADHAGVVAELLKDSSEDTLKHHCGIIHGRHEVWCTGPSVLDEIFDSRKETASHQTTTDTSV